MSESSETDIEPTPWHLWAVGVVALLWNAMGALDYVMTQTRNEDYMSGYTPSALRSWAAKIERWGRAGDVFAWRTPAGSPSRHTGHTGFAMERPRPVPGLRDAYALRVADSIVGPHQDDTRPPGTAGGLGFGVFVFLTDGDGNATHYGWHGTRTAGYMRTAIHFGRLSR